VLIKKIENYFYLALIVFISIKSMEVYAGADPDEVNIQDEIEIQNIVAQEKKVVEENLINIATIKKCVSFPEAVAFKEHFACQHDIEKNYLARSRWSFLKLDTNY